MAKILVLEWVCVGFISTMFGATPVTPVNGVVTINAPGQYELVEDVS